MGMKEWNLDFGGVLAKAASGEIDDNELARRDFATFMKRVVKDDNTGDLVDLQPFQYEVIEVINRKAECTLVVLPRGFTKSTIAQAYAAWEIGNDPNIRIILASNTEDQSISKLTGIENILRSSEYQEIFGDLVPKDRRAQWSATVKTVLRPRASQHPTLKGVGATGSKIVGARASLIIVDDIIDPESANSPAERDRIWNWLMGALENVQRSSKSSDGEPPRMLIVNTRYHLDDVAGRMRELHKDSGSEEFEDIDIPALRKRKNPETGEEEEYSIWESMESTEKLKRMRQRNYYPFQTNMMNDPINTEDSRLDEEWMNLKDAPSDILDGPEERGELVHYFGIDPNTGRTDVKTDFFAIIVVAVNREDDIVYVRDMYYGKDDLKFIKERFQAMYTRYRPEAIYLESNAAQILYATLFSDEDPTQYPFVSIPSVISKEERIQAMANYFINKRVRVLSVEDENGRLTVIPALEPLRTEWLTFPQSKDSHFDALDGLSFALRIISSYLNEASISVITPEDFARRMKLEQDIRTARTFDRKLAERLEARLEKERETVHTRDIAEQGPEVEGKCEECHKVKLLHIDSDGRACYDCHIDLLRRRYEMSYNPMVPFDNDVWEMPTPMT